MSDTLTNPVSYSKVSYNWYGQVECLGKEQQTGHETTQYEHINVSTVNEIQKCAWLYSGITSKLTVYTHWLGLPKVVMHTRVRNCHEHHW